MKRLRVKVYGRVQGIGFRYFVKKVANKLNLDGWVKNNPDGTVEILAQGPDKTLNEFLEHCKKGPFLAKVEKIDISEDKSKGEFRGFDIIY